MEKTSRLQRGLMHDGMPRKGFYAGWFQDSLDVLAWSKLGLNTETRDFTVFTMNTVDENESENIAIHDASARGDDC
jgi:hypothetical protein